MPFSRVRVWPFDVQATQEYGRIFAVLYRKGRMIQQIDIQFAATALNPGNCTVVTADADLSIVTGLSVENWAS